MPIDQLAELLVRWRGADGVMDRARLLRGGMQLLGGLDAAERRVLARSLGEQGAPALAERIEGWTGGALSSDQLRGVADGLLNLDEHQVDRLAASLRDPAERDRLAREAVTQAVDAFDLGPGAGYDYRAHLDELPPPGGSRGGDAGHVEVDADGQELHGPELGGQQLGTAEVVEAGIADVGLHEPEAEPRALDRATEDDEPARPGRPEVGGRDPRSGSSVASPPPADAEADTSTGEEAHHGPDDEAGADAAALLDDLRRAETATARLRLLEPDVLARIDGGTALAVLEALPDGWQRRRGALRLVDAGSFPTRQLAEALGRLSRATDATFVAGALLAAGQVHAEQFDGILPERVVHRLTARSER